MKDHVAVIGMACRLPGAESVDEFWHLLRRHADAIGEFPDHRRFDIEQLNHTSQQKCHDVPCRLGGFLQQIDQFDAGYFGLSSSQAASMDPSHRLFLETAHEALEHAGYTRSSLNGSSTGVFVGFSPNEDMFLTFFENPDPQLLVENQPAMMPYRLSYWLNLKGPTYVIDTSCSSSLVALHQACRALQSGDCQQAVVAGVNLHFFPALRDIENLGLEAFDGRCKTFDAKADGTNIGEGVVVLVLKLLQEAERDGDTIHLTICSSAINSDGHSNGLTAPHPQAQADVIVKAWKEACISPDQLSFIETHGTGTKLGDPIEIYALAKAFSAYGKAAKKHPLGALKTNIGHLEAAAGLTSVLKAAACLSHGMLPHNLHYTTPNPLIDWEEAPVYPTTEDITLSDEAPVYAAISSFGLTGTNAHVVVSTQKPAPRSADTSHESSPLLLSAPSYPQLHALLQRYVRFFEEKTDIIAGDLAWTAATCRDRGAVRLGIWGDYKETAYELLKQWQDPSMPPPHHPHAASNQPSFQGQGKLEKCLQQFFTSPHFVFEEWYPRGKKCPLPTSPRARSRCWPQLLAAAPRQELLKDVTYSLQWQESMAPAQTPLQGTYLLFCDPSNQRHQQILTALRREGVAHLPVFKGELFSITPEGITIRPTVAEDYLSLILEAKARFGTSWKGLIHLWTSWQYYDSNSIEDAAKAVDDGAISLVHLAHALDISSYKEPLNLTAVSTEVHTITGKENGFPAAAALEGICKVLSQENPFVTSLFIDADNQTSPQALLCECAAITPLGEASVALRAGKRYTSIIAPLDSPSLPGRQRPPHAGGHYLIAGGIGYLGLKTARLLAEQFPIKLTLVGRSDAAFLNAHVPPPAALGKKALKQYEAVSALRKLGSEVYYLQGDVSQQESCHKTMNEAVRTSGAIDGIFLAIKNISHTRLKDLSAAVCRSNIMTKISATLLLAEQGRELDFFALFSSISSLTGGPTGADCCASNLFLDAYAEREAKQHAISMNFTLVAADDGSLQADRLSMIPPLSPSLFLESLQMFLTKELSFGVIARFSPRVLPLVLPLMKIRFSTALLEKLQPTKTTPVGLLEPREHSITDATAIAEGIESIWEETLGRPCKDRSVHFFQAGGDSILAARLTQRLRSRLHLTVDIADLYAHPKLDAFIAHLFPAQSPPPPQDSLDTLLDMVASGAVDIDQACSTIKGTYA